MPPLQEVKTNGEKMLPPPCDISYDRHMGILSSQQSKGIFRQLADVDGGAGVKTVIENHDAWVHNESIAAEINATIVLAAAGKQRSDAVRDKILHQRALLGTELSYAVTAGAF